MNKKMLVVKLFATFPALTLNIYSCKHIPKCECAADAAIEFFIFISSSGSWKEPLNLVRLKFSCDFISIGLLLLLLHLFDQTTSAREVKAEPKHQQQQLTKEIDGTSSCHRTFLKFPLRKLVNRICCSEYVCVWVCSLRKPHASIESMAAEHLGHKSNTNENPVNQLHRFVPFDAFSACH